MSSSAQFWPTVGALCKRCPSCQSQPTALTIHSLQPGGFTMGHLQAGLVLSEITLFTRLDSENLATWPNCRSWRRRIMKVIGLISVSSGTLSFIKKIVSGISHDPAKNSDTKRVQMATSAGSDSPSFTAVSKTGRTRARNKLFIFLLHYYQHLQTLRFKGIHHRGRYFHASIGFEDKSSPAAYSNPKVHKVVK